MGTASGEDAYESTLEMTEHCIPARGVFSLNESDCHSL